MSITLISSISSLFAIAVISFFVSYTAFKKTGRTSADISFANCWVAIGLTFFLMGLRTTFFGLGLPAFDKAIAYVVQVSLVFVIISIGHYSITTSIKNKLKKSLLFFLIFLTSIAFLYLLVLFGLEEPLISEWGSEYTASLPANILFGVIGVLGLFLLGLSFFKAKKFKNQKEMIATGSLILIIIFGTIEQLGNVGWQILMIRVAILFSVLLAYSAYELDKYKIK